MLIGLAAVIVLVLFFWAWRSFYERAEPPVIQEELLQRDLQREFRRMMEEFRQVEEEGLSSSDPEMDPEEEPPQENKQDDPGRG